MALPYKKISDEVLKHFANPKNFGEMPDADGIGTGVDNATKSFATIYLKIEDERIEKISFVGGGSEDVIILASVLTEMVEGDTLENAIRRIEGLEKDVEAAYDAVEPPKIDLSKPEGEQVTPVSTQSQDSANIVLTAFRAALRHMERKAEGIEEKSFTMSIAKRCPYSNTDCAFVTPAQSDSGGEG
ncbi:iron-sulfur cluster assembly scaffold protein [Hydrogenimonas sp.]